MKKKFRIKPGYIILALIAIIYFIIQNHNKEQKRVQFYTKQVKNLLNNLIDGNYFSFQSSLDRDLSNNLSLDAIDKFSKEINLSKDYKIQLDNIDDDNRSNILVNGNILNNKSKSLKFLISFKDKNKTFYINSIKINNLQLKNKVSNNILLQLDNSN